MKVQFLSNGFKISMKIKNETVKAIFTDCTLSEAKKQFNNEYLN